MRTITTLFILVLCINRLWAFGQKSQLPAPDPAKGLTGRDLVVATADKFIGVTEATGNNDGPEIEAMQKSAGISKGDPYCAAFCRYVYDLSGYENIGPRNGWAPSWTASPTWKQGEGKEPKPGDIGGIYFNSMGRVAHVFIVKQWETNTVLTIEANTSPDASVGSDKDREGEGIWSKRRLKKQVYSVRNWIDK